MTVKYVSSWSQICAQITSELSKPLDPLTLNLVVVPSAGHQRELSQYIAATLPAQVCAGVDFTTPSGLRTRLMAELLHVTPQSDPWRHTSVSLALVEAFERSFGDEWFEPLARYFGAAGERPGRRLNTARRISRLFRNYFRLQPDLLSAWAKKEDIDPNGKPLPDESLWQPNLWRAVREIIASPDPLERQRQLLTAIKRSDTQLPGRIFAGLVTSLVRYEQEVLDALGEQILVYSLASRPAEHSLLASRYGLNRPTADIAVDTNSTSMLGSVQHDIWHDQTPASEYVPDGSIQFHLSHGPHRQVEVLRDVLTGLFQDDPTLEPRDVLVLAPNLDKYSTHIAAAFGQDNDRAEHPGTKLRVSLSSSSLLQNNPIREALAVLLRMLRGRARVSDLIGFLSLKPVARRFHFDADDITQIGEIMANANVSWGVDTAHRQSYGLGDQTLGTWWKGVESALVGAVFADCSPTVLRDVVAMSNMESGMLNLLGKLSEALCRIRKAKFTFARPTDATEWVERLRSVMDDLTEVDPLHGKQKMTVLSQLNALSQAASGLGAQLELSDVADWFEDMTEQSYGRPNFGSGDLLVASLGELQGVQRRVICLLGIGEDDFPRHRRRIGDDLLADIPQADDLRVASRQQLLDAILAAKDKLIVVTQGASQRTGVISSPPVAVLDLLSACGVRNPKDVWEVASSKLIRRYPLQAHSTRNFTGQQASFDIKALCGAQAKLLEPPFTLPPSAWEFPAPKMDEIGGEKLLSFLRNPAAELLNSATGVKLKVWDDEFREQLPIAPTGLDQYNIRKRLVEARLAGMNFEQALYAEALTGGVLRNEAGSQMIHSIADEAEEIVRNVQAFSDGPEVEHDCSLTFDSTVLRWPVTTNDNQVVIYRCGGLKGLALVEAWLKLVFLASCGQSAEKAVVVVKDETRILKSPDKTSAQSWLSELVGLYRSGLTQLVPLPVETAAAYVGLTGRNKNAVLRARSAWADEYNHFGEWYNDESWQYFFPDPDELWKSEPRRSDPTPRYLSRSEGRFERLAGWLYRPIRSALSSGWGQ